VLKSQVLDEGVHSGGASGVVPSVFHHTPCLGRLEEQRHRTLLPQSFHCAIPADQLWSRKPAATLGDRLF
jgi:hypothetical protein